MKSVLFAVLLLPIALSAEPGERWTISVQELNRAQTIQEQVDLLSDRLADSWIGFLGSSLGPKLRQMTPPRIKLDSRKRQVTVARGRDQVKISAGEVASAQYQVNGRTIAITSATGPEQLERWLSAAISPKALRLDQLTPDQASLALTSALLIAHQEASVECDQRRAAVQVCGLLHFEALERQTQARLYTIYDRKGREAQLNSVRRSRSPASADDWKGKVRGSVASRLVKRGVSCSSAHQLRRDDPALLGLGARLRDLRRDIKEAVQITGGEDAGLLASNLESLEEVSRQLEKNDLSAASCRQKIASWSPDMLSELGEEFNRARAHLDGLLGEE